jgi:hypothetical protein
MNDGPQRTRKSLAARVLETLASLKLTVALFALSLILVFFGTLAQIDGGTWTVVRDYFRSFYVWIPLQLVVQFVSVFFSWALSENAHLCGAFPFPGGWTLGGLLLTNLLAAHLARFRLSWKRAGVLILHAGVILMMVGELITGLYAVEGHMAIAEGQTTNVVVHNRDGVIERTKKPYALKLLEFRFERHPGVSKPKHFSSRVLLIDPELSEEREVLITMNEPLRHRGETLYQVGWDEETERGTVLQVVRNPGWMLPYLSCAVVTLGMCVYFGLHLAGYLRRRAES